jgi:two-component system, OmpR family, sensor histidine kinase MtrB
VRSRLGLRTSIALTIAAVTLTATAVMALVPYQLQASTARERFTAAALAGFESDARQAGRPVFRGRPSVGSKVDEVADYMNGRLGITWAVFNFNPTFGQVSTVQDGRYTVSAATAEPGPPGGAPRWIDHRQLPVSTVDQARHSQRPVIYTADTEAGQRLIIIGPVVPDLLLAEFYSTQRLDDELAALRLQLGAVAVTVTLCGVVIGLLAARRIQRPVRTAAAAARKLGAGALDTRLLVHGRDELADLAGSFNTMAQRLGESIAQLRAKDQQQQRFIADVAHDLRTPLASMIAATESLNSSDPWDRARSAELLGTQVRRLSTLVEDLLEMSRFDAGAAEFRPEHLDLHTLATDAVAISAPQAHIPIDHVGDPTMFGDPRRLHTIIRNLVTNAVRHGAPPITVTIDGRAATQITVTVADSGPGLPADLAPFIFDRFVRGDHARQHTEGSGLGLAIANENAALHGGRIEATNDAGAIFTLTLPRDQSTPHLTLTDVDHGANRT